MTKGKDCALVNGQMKFGGMPNLKPTHDSIQLARWIDARWHTSSLSPAGLQQLVEIYGDRVVEDKLRELHGFPPEEAIRSPYAYLVTMLREGL